MNLLIHTTGRSQRLDTEFVNEGFLTGTGALGPFVAITMKGDGYDFVVHMGIDPTQPINSFARRDIDLLTGLHLLCFGPVILAGLDEEAAEKVVHG